MERVEGIEPSWPAWKAGTLPLSYTRATPDLTPDHGHDATTRPRFSGQAPEGTAAPGSGEEDRFGGGKGILAADGRGYMRMFLSGGTARASAPSYPRSSACIRGQISSFSPATRFPWARAFPRAIAPRGPWAGHGGLSQGAAWRADKNSYHGEARRRLPPPSPDEWSAAPM